MSGRFLVVFVAWILGGPAQAGLSGALSGAWYDPAYDGAGFLVEILPDDRSVVYWFTYDDTGTQQWYVGVGEVDGSEILIDALQAARGARFGPRSDPEDVELRTVGSLTIAFDSCTSATARFSVDGQSGEQTLNRLVEVRDLPCVSIDAGAAAPASLNQTASWFAPERSGEGFTVELIDDRTAFVNWFTFDEAGNPAWFTGIASVASQSVVIEDLLSTTGGRFGPEHDPAAVVRERVGRVELYLDCSNGRVNYDMDARRPSGFHELARLTDIAGLPCESDRYSTPSIADLIGFWESDGFGAAAAVAEDSVVFFQTTASCLPVQEVPVALVEQAIGLGEIRINQRRDRVEFGAVDSVTPVFLDRVSALPSHCAGGGTGFSTDPRYNYEVFAATYGELYAAFDVRGVDWAAQRSAFGPQVTSATSEAQLFGVFSRMLAPLVDLHTTIRAPDRFFGSGITPAGQAYFQRAQSSDTDLILGGYLQGAGLTGGGGTLGYGLLDGGLGYLEIRSFSVVAGGATGAERMAYYRNELDRIFRFFEDQGVEPLVIDVRRNEGGDSAFGFELASRLLRGRTRTIFSERRLNAAGETEPYVQQISPGNRIEFDGEIALLTGRITGSAAETFTFAIRALPHATLIGEPTAGVLSRTERVLPNGWIVSLTVGRIASPEGAFYEASGIPPHIAVPVFTDAEYASGRDSALEEAINLLGAG